MDNHTFIVAELSANHGGSIDIAKDSIAKAKAIGCDAVKIQTARPDGITLDCDSELFRINTGTIWDGRLLYDLYKETHLPWRWHHELFDFARGRDMILFSSPFEFAAVDLLEDCGNPIYKIASFEITDIPLIKYAASKKKPMILSTGIATSAEIGEAVNACRSAGNDDICLLQCTSEYPADPCDARLSNMIDMKQQYHVKTGLSDHSEDPLVAETAAAMGASVIEKHFTLDRSIGGPDASFSIEPADFEKMIKRIRRVEVIKGEPSYALTDAKKKSRKFARSLFVIHDVKKGETVSENNIGSIRPSDGIAPKYYDDVIGKTFNEDFKAGTPLSHSMIEENEDTVSNK